MNKKSTNKKTALKGIFAISKVNIFARDAIKMSKKAINRIKVVLVEKNISSKWLAEKLDKNEATVSRWCTNDVQPPLTTLVKIADVLKVKVTDLLNDKQK
jgi:putative transcriptional regulator